MKKIVLLILVLVGSVSALQLEEGEELVLDDVNESLLAVGGTLDIGDVNGAVNAFGGTVTIDGIVERSVLACGGEVNVNGDIDTITVCGGDVSINGNLKNVMVAGGNININGNISGDVRVAGGNIEINGDVGGDVLAAGGSININGDVQGGAAITAGVVRINGIIEDDVIVTADEISLGNDAIIYGDLKYTSARSPRFEPEQVKGDVLKGVPAEPAVSSQLTWLLEKVYSALSMMVLGIILVLLMPKASQKLIDKLEDYWKALLYGFIVLAAVPLAAVALMFTIIGLPAALLLIALYVIAIYLSRLVVALYIGHRISQEKRFVLPMVIGVLIYVAIVSIPYIGGLIQFIAVLLGLGAMAMLIKK